MPPTNTETSCQRNFEETKMLLRIGKLLRKKYLFLVQKPAVLGIYLQTISLLPQTKAQFVPGFL